MHYKFQIASYPYPYLTCCLWNNDWLYTINVIGHKSDVVITSVFFERR